MSKKSHGGSAPIISLQPLFHERKSPADAGLFMLGAEVFDNEHHVGNLASLLVLKEFGVIFCINPVRLACAFGVYKKHQGRKALMFCKLSCSFFLQRVSGMMLWSPTRVGGVAGTRGAFSSTSMWVTGRNGSRAWPKSP